MQGYTHLTDASFGEIVDIRIAQIKRHIERASYVLSECAKGKRNDLSDKDYDGIVSRIEYLEAELQRLEDSRDAWIALD